MYSVFTIPDTGRDSRVMQGEVDGCISLALPVIDLEQSQHFSDMPPLVKCKANNVLQRICLFLRFVVT